MKLLRTYINIELLNDIKNISKTHKCSISFIIRTVLKDYVQYYKFQNNVKDE